MIERYFVPGIVVQRYTETEDALGNVVKSWGTHTITDGLIDALTGSERRIADAEAVVATHVLFCPVIDITERDRVVYNGQTYQVKFVDNPMNFGRFLQVDLEVIR